MLQSEIEHLLKASAHRVREWVSTLEPLCSKPRMERSATRYSAQEVLYLAVISLLQDAGITSKSLASISAGLFDLLRRPSPLGQDDTLILWKTSTGWEFKGKLNPHSVQVRVPVFVARELVRGQFDDAVLWVQAPLNLGMSAVRSPLRTGTR